MNIYTPQLSYYIYAYLRKDGTPYYIGKGKEKRAWTKQHSVPVPHDNKKIVIVEANLTELGAFALERRLIRWYGRKDNGTGILRNLTNGGEGPSGAILSEETRLKMSAAKKGHLLSEEHKLKISEALKGRNKGYKHSDETRKSMSIAAKGRIVSPETRLKMSKASKGRIHSEETRLDISEARSKIWFFIDPNGNEFTIKNLTRFCRENNLGQTEMVRVSKGKKKSYKGWMKL
jgi:hypothetical protein